MSGGLRTGRRRERQRPTPSTALQTPVALCGGGELKGAEDEEEAFLTVRVAAFQHSPEGRGRRRMLALKLKGVSGCRSPEEQKELEHLKVVYPEGPSQCALPKAIELKLSSLGD